MLAQWINQAKMAMLETLSLLSYVDFLIFLGCFLIFVLFYFVGCITARVKFFVPLIFKIFALIALLGSPIVVWWFNGEILFKSKVDYKMAKSLEYSPTFFIDAMLTNVGRLEIKQCYFVLNVLRESQGYKSKIIDILDPIKIYKYKIDETIKQGQSIRYTQTINDFPYKLYRMHFSCYGG